MIDLDLDDLELYEERPNPWLKWGYRLLFVVVIYLFRRELWMLVQIAGYLILPYIGIKAPAIPPLKDLGLVLLLPIANVIGAIGLEILFLYLIAGVVLPVRNREERRSVYERLRDFMRGNAGAVVFIREGRVDAREEPGNLGGGAALLDLDSAIVLERSWSAGGKSSGGSSARYPMARVAGPGLNFIGKGEQLRGVVSLRNQIRVNEKVKASTSEGIEILADVYTVFTLVQPPRVIKVAYVKDLPDAPEELREILIDEDTKTVISASELDGDDRKEIESFAQRFLQSGEAGTWLQPEENSTDFPPYPLDKERILDAIYWQGREIEEKKRLHWTEMPAQVATEIFRDEISKKGYDDLYSQPNDDGAFPLLEDFKPQFARLVRNQGTLRYQFLYSIDGRTLAVGDKFNHRNFRVSPVQDLQIPKVLRRKGINVVDSGFSVLRPGPDVLDLRTEYWRANWQQEADIIHAEFDREVERANAQARLVKQREIVNKLRDILKAPSNTEQAVILLVLQALEDVAADPNARSILTGEALQLMQSLQPLLLAEEIKPPKFVQDQSPGGEDEQDE
jgi:hypothetical protein